MQWPEPLEALLVALFVPRCVSCDRALAVRPRYGLCDPCFEVLEPNIGSRCPRCDLLDCVELCPPCKKQAPAFSSLRAPFVYGGPIADLLVAAKFRGREDLATAAGQLLASDDSAHPGDVTAVIPIPLGSKRKRERGYNQAAIIARQLKRAWGVPVVHALKRVRNTALQTDLSLAARRENMRGAFAVRKKLSGRVVLVDDVVTSGETVRQASRALKNAGATEVVVVAVARAVVGQHS